MYIVDFFKRLARKSNIPLIIYLVLNVFLTGAVMCMMFGLYDWEGMLSGIVLYVVSLAIALSPVGEWILRLQTGCKKIKRAEQIEFLEPLFKEVYEKAKELDSSIPDDVQLYINNDEAPNAFATGRKTICLTEGMLHMPKEQIKATLGHEFGHLAHKDTDMILLVTVGNLIVNLIILGIRLIISFFYIIFSAVAGFLEGSNHGLVSLIKEIYYLLITFIVSGLVWIWTKIGTLLVMKSSRSNEFEADEFSYNLGYGNDLCAVLDVICDSKAKGLFASLASTHPHKDDRIAKLQELGASYRVTYGK